MADEMDIVFETDSEVEMQQYRAYLEEAEIPVEARQVVDPWLNNIIFTNASPRYQLLVPPDRAEEAIRLLEQLQQAETTDMPEEE